MRDAAVKLRHVEQKVKLKRQLEAEEKIEAARRAKIAEANREIELSRRKDSANSGSS
jgi:hypothetical protein